MCVQGKGGPTFIRPLHCEFRTLCAYETVSTQAFGTEVSEVVKAPRYKPGDRRFDTRQSERFPSIYLVPPAAIGPEAYSTSNKNEYQKQK
jgi:hypothetical protein